MLAIEQADFKGAAQHIALAEQVGAKRRIVQPAQMPQGTCEAGAGEYAAGKYDSMIIKPEYYLPYQGPFTLLHLEQSAFAWQSRHPALRQPLHGKLALVQANQSRGQGAIIQQPGPDLRRQLCAGMAAGGNPVGVAFSVRGNSMSARCIWSVRDARECGNARQDASRVRCHK